ncbi:proline--tRNA ligase [Treponema denticola]|uniref:proline--tRNA ligase n=1 Tax=Treponema denticola TaxID=158 RepID=UPI002107B5EA|nr:proline--tRNA ligase [Treponema denticola]UTY26483.1 proline--tRNA ligase [Treponema denticola]
MKMTQMYMPTLREIPNEAVVESHKLLLRAGMIRNLANGLFAYLPLGLKAFRKVEKIIREEMDAIGCLEFKPPVIVPGEIWQESGRWDSMGPELLRIKNRLNQELVVSPTAEEAFTALLKNELSSYKNYPLLTYQINTKYRDEIRPRYGLMRTREFTMKDAYSFHTNDKSLDEAYLSFEKAYIKIFKRCGLTVIGVKADSGAMGGSGSQEFMVESSVGDDTLLICPSCGYAANEEKAACAPDKQPENGNTSQDSTPVMEEIDTPDVRTIEALASFLKRPSDCLIKALIYRIENSEVLAAKTADNKHKNGIDGGQLVAVCIRGDLEVNEAKLKSALKASEAVLTSDREVEEVTGTVIGFIGPAGLKNIPIIADESVMLMHDTVTGALKRDKHLIHVEPLRDFTPDYIFDLRTVRAGDKCAVCGTALYTKKGNELGHIFKLGYKYTKAMNMTYLDENGKQQHPSMGCYGIGLDRLTASIVEEHHDEDGIIWPMTIAPFQVAIVPIKYEGEMQKEADRLYEECKKRGIEALLDDRKERTGVKFKDMDLIGIPIRLVVGEKNLPNIEFKLRKAGESSLIDKDKVVDLVEKTVKEELAKLN